MGVPQQVHPSRLYALEEVELPEDDVRPRWARRVLTVLLVLAMGAFAAAVVVGARGGDDDTAVADAPADVATALRNDPLARFALPPEVGADRTTLQACAGAGAGTDRLVGWRATVAPGHRAGAVLVVGRAAESHGWTLVAHERRDPAASGPPVSVPGDAPDRPDRWAAADHLTYVKDQGRRAAGWKVDVYATDANVAVLLAAPDRCR